MLFPLLYTNVCSFSTMSDRMPVIQAEGSIQRVQAHARPFLKMSFYFPYIDIEFTYRHQDCRSRVMALLKIIGSCSKLYVSSNRSVHWCASFPNGPIFKTGIFNFSITSSGNVKPLFCRGIFAVNRDNRLFEETGPTKLKSESPVKNSVTVKSMSCSCFVKDVISSMTLFKKRSSYDDTAG